MTPFRILSFGTGTGGTGTYNISTSTTAAAGTTLWGGLDPVVTPRVFGGSAAAVGQNWSGKRAYLQGDSQVNNGLFQSRMASVSGVNITSQGTPGRDMGNAATAIAGVDLTNFDIVINDHGTNDFGGNVALGTIADGKAVASFFGRMEKWLDAVLTTYPAKRVVFFGPTPRTDTLTNGLGLTLKDYNDAILGPQTLAALAKALGMTDSVTPIPDGYWPMLSRIESGDRPYVKAASSSASGLYQFIRSTWIAEGGQWGSDLSQAFGGLKPAPEEQLQRAKTFTARNAEYLAGKGIPINKASLYAAHFFGPVTAAKVIAADVNARADLIAGTAATKANPSILGGKTVGQFLTWLHGKTGDWAR